MNKIDISELSYAELMSLKNEIKRKEDELNKTVFSKRNLGELAGCKEVFERRFPPEHFVVDSHLNFIQNNGRRSSEIAWDANSKTKDKIIALCDIAFANYYLNNHSDRSKSTAIRVKKTAPWKYVDDYKEMFNRISDIFIEYANKHDESEAEQNHVNRD